MLFGFINLCCRGGGQAVQGGLSCPHLGIMFSVFNAHSTCFKLSVHEVVSFIIIIQVKLSCYLCCLVSLTFVAGVGGKLSRLVYLAPTWVLCLTVFNAHSTCFKLSVHEVVSFIIIIQVKLSCFLCCSVSNP